MDPWQKLFHYCERTSSAFWAEPLNATTNAAFLLASGAAFLLWLKQDARDKASLLLIIVAAITGAGSFLFHTFATRWAMLADVIPIAIFIYAYFLLSLVRYIGLQLPTGLVGTAAFAAFSFGIEAAVPRWFLNGSAAYLPALIALAGVPAVLVLRAQKAGGDIERSQRMATARMLAISCVIFAASLCFRTIDREVCQHVPAGTHFLWHLLNALVLYLLLRAAILWRS